MLINKRYVMKISEILKKDRPSLSFEVFPPKTDAVYETVRTAVDEIAKTFPSFMSVTYGAGGGTSGYTVSIAQEIQKKKCCRSCASFVHIIDEDPGKGAAGKTSGRGD